MLVGQKRISTALALGLLAAGLTGSARAQAPANNQNQDTAEAVAASLRSSPALAGYRIEIQTRGGLVTLTGVVASPAQKAEAIGRAQHSRGVTQVADQIRVSSDPRVLPAQYQMARGGHIPNLGTPVNGGVANGGVANGGMVSSPVAGGMAGGPVMSESGAYVGGDAAMMDGPAPEGVAGSVVGGGGSAQPGMPNYAWPSTAPYPNVSAVGYPTAYPWQAFPNIGPFYPYPEVPLDWRAVTLRWDDGIWWLDFKKHYTRPFFTPYPFGIFAY